MATTRRSRILCMTCFALTFTLTSQTAYIGNPIIQETFTVIVDDPVSTSAGTTHQETTTYITTTTTIIPNTGMSTAGTATTGPELTVTSMASATIDSATMASTTMASTTIDSTTMASTTMASTTMASTNTDSTSSSYVTSTSSITDVVNAKLRQALYESFKSTPAFLEVQTATTMVFSTTKAHQFWMYFNKTFLSEHNLLTGDMSSPFFANLTSSMTSFLQANITLPGSHTVNNQSTEISMNATIYLMSGQFSNATFVCSGVACDSVSDACHVTNGQVNCSHKCDVYSSDFMTCYDVPVYGVYVAGTCKLDPTTYVPYCNCGMSPGDVLSNFYDGTNCVSATFVVAMAASAGGFLLIVIIVLFVVVCRKQPSGKHSRSNSVSYQLDDHIFQPHESIQGFDNKAFPDKQSESQHSITASSHTAATQTSPSDVTPAHVVATTDVSNAHYTDAPVVSNGYHTPPALIVANGHYAQQAPPVANDYHTQQAPVVASGYHIDDATVSGQADDYLDPSMASLADTDAYRNFKPRVDHVDVHANYAIRRPTISYERNEHKANNATAFL